MSNASAVVVEQLRHHYGERCALAGLDLEIARGEIFAILGPNGGGKTTLFRLLSTLISVQQGRIEILGHDVRSAATAVRQRLGVVFQAPSVDKQLTVGENLRLHGPLVGLTGRGLRAAMAEMLERLRLTDRANERVSTLSGGLRRRVELAKGLLHRPPVLLLDEPSTGLDPGARADLWQYLRQLRDEAGTTIVVTTHLLEEAERVDRLAILDSGRIVALDTPERLRATVGGDAITIETSDPEELVAQLAKQLGRQARVIDGRVRLEEPAGHRLIPSLIDALPGRIQSVTLGRPTLEDVFIARTGHRLSGE